MAGEWTIFLDAGVTAAAREDAWTALHERLRLPVLLQLRRGLSGLRETEQLTEQFCELFAARHGGGGGAAPSLREAVARDLEETLADENASERTVGEEFDRDWAASLCHAALRRLGKTHPRTQRLLLKLYDQPEGQPPLTPELLARKLERGEDEVRQTLAEGREALLAAFEAEIDRTVTTTDAARAEMDRLYPFLAKLF